MSQWRQQSPSCRSSDPNSSCWLPERACRFHHMKCRPDKSKTKSWLKCIVMYHPSSSRPPYAFCPKINTSERVNNWMQLSTWMMNIMGSACGESTPTLRSMLPTVPLPSISNVLGRMVWYHRGNPRKKFCWRLGSLCSSQNRMLQKTALRIQEVMWWKNFHLTGILRSGKCF